MKKLLLAGVLALSVVYAGESHIELEHAIKTPSSLEDQGGDMSKMRAAGKCGANQSTQAHKRYPTKASRATLELEHAVKSASSLESPKVSMSKMKAAGKCGAGQSVKTHKAYPTKVSKTSLRLQKAIQTPSSVEDQTRH